jgi:hypothetical protein
VFVEEDMLENNDMGKLDISVEHDRTKNNVTALLEEGRRDGTAKYTLFYMPRFPMGLNCNVLWAHWDHISRLLPGGANRNSGYDPMLISDNALMHTTKG